MKTHVTIEAVAARLQTTPVPPDRIAALPENDRMAFAQLHGLLGYPKQSVAEVARGMGVHLTTVYRCHREAAIRLGLA